MKPGPFTTKTVKELFIQGTEPTQTDDLRRTIDIDAASGLRWQDGCVGPKKTVGALDFSQVDANHPNWQQADNGWARRAAARAGRRRRPEGHAHGVLLRRRLLPVRPDVGRDLRADQAVPARPAADAAAVRQPVRPPCPPPSGEPAPTPPTARARRREP